MRIAVMAVLVGAAWAFCASVALTGLAWGLTPWVLRASRTRAAATRADVLFSLRVLPVLGALSAGATAGVVFVCREPLDAAEIPSRMLLMSAMAFTLLTVMGARAGVRAVRRTDATRRAWTTGAVSRETGELVSCRVPTAAVVGVWRPTIFLGRDLCASLTARELDAVTAHERAHARGYDNARRLLLASAPDLFGRTSRGSVLTREWRSAVEQAADDAVVERDADAACDLASALIKAARLVRPSLAESAVCQIVDEGPVGTRVRKLLERPGQRHVRSTLDRVSALGMMMALSVSLACVAVAYLGAQIQALSERLVNAPW